jgi:CheY-like chemotaxis protein
MRGIDATTSLKINPETDDIPILIYPPWDFADATKAALKAGAAEVLKEPITLQSFRQALQKYAPSDTDLDRRNMFLQ